MLKSVQLTEDRCAILWEDDYYLINVSQIIWIHPEVVRLKATYEKITREIVQIRFEDGSTLDVLNSKDEILEMLILKPWWKNLIDFIKWLFIKKRRVK